MEKKEKIISYKAGDKVFAKVKGYPPWPAKIVSDTGKKKYNVLFYGTQETGVIKPENLAFYSKYKDTYVQRHLKRAGYEDAVKQIEADLANEGDDGNNADESADDLDTTLADSSIAKTSKEKTHKTAESDESISVKTPKLRKRSIASESEESDSKKPRRESSSSFASKTDDENNIENKSSNMKERKNTLNEEKEDEKTDKDNENAGASEIEDVPETATEDKDKDQTGSEINDEPEKSKESELETSTNIMEAEDEEKPVKKNIGNIEIVTKKMLNNNILYAEHVNKTPDLFKEKAVETTRQASKDDVYSFKLPSGKICGVRLYKEWPINHSNEYERALYDGQISKSALEVETLLTTGKKTITEIENMEVIPDIEITEADLKEITYAKDANLDSKKRRLERHKKEAELVTWDTKIKYSLGLDKATPDAAIETLKEFKKLEKDVDALMFMKHPHVLDSLRRLRKYVGNTREWSMSNSDLEDFTKKAEKIRNEAENIYDRLWRLFDIKEDKSLFWDAFMQIVSNFRMKCKDLTETQVLGLCAEPDSRQAFFDRLDEVSEPNEKK